jgi:hypothetical protein
VLAGEHHPIPRLDDVAERPQGHCCIEPDGVG